MSHFSQMKTSLKNERFLKEALKTLGYQIEENPAGTGVEVRGYFGETQKADFKILTKTHYDIGFLKSEDGSFEIVGDWELLPKVSDIDQAQFMASVKREYAKTSIVETAKEQGYAVECQENAETGEIEMVVTQW